MHGFCVGRAHDEARRRGESGDVCERFADMGDDLWVRVEVLVLAGREGGGARREWKERTRSASTPERCLCSDVRRVF